MSNRPCRDMVCSLNKFVYRISRCSSIKSVQCEETLQSGIRINTGCISSPGMESTFSSSLLILSSSSFIFVQAEIYKLKAISKTFKLKLIWQVKGT